MNASLKRKAFAASPLPARGNGSHPRGGSDHDHCRFCWAKISAYDGDLHEGYCTPDEYIWICPECFADFKDDFHWRIIEGESNPCTRADEK